MLATPVGSAGLIEAAYAWRQLRVPIDQRSTSSPHRLPFMEAPWEDVATRISRLLAVVTWATVRIQPVMGRVPPGCILVEVPGTQYHRLDRALAGAWREAERLRERPTATGMHPSEVAVAVWRMAILLNRQDLRPDLIDITVTAARQAPVLVGAARQLGLALSLRKVGGVAAVRVCGAGTVHRLLTATVSADPGQLRAHA